MLLPGKFAQVNRGKIARILHHYYAGSAKLKAHIDRNAASLELLHMLAREALTAERAAESQHAEKDTGEVSMVLASDLSTLLKFHPPSISDRCSNRRRCHHGRGCNIR